MLSVTVLLLVAGFVCTIVSAIGKCPLWVPVLIAYVVLLLQVLPR